MAVKLIRLPLSRHYWLSHPCDHPGCTKQGCFGFDCFLLRGKGGRWYCAEHKETQDAIAKLTMTPQMLVSELRRELKMRARVYPAWVNQGKLSRADADHRVRALDQVLAVIEAIYAEELKPAQGSLV